MAKECLIKTESFSFVLIVLVIRTNLILGLHYFSI